MGRMVDESGKRYGRITVVSRSGTTSDGKVAWLCRCDCGNTTEVGGGHLRSGNTTSCGCYGIELLTKRNTKHGLFAASHAFTPEYNSWLKMRSRCNDPANPDYLLYGGRGIRVCKEWENSFEKFFAHVGKRPAAGYTIDRKNTDDNYEPGNVRWATAVQQQNNRRNNVELNLNGEKITYKQAASISSVTRKAIAYRLSKGWTLEDAIKTPDTRGNPRTR